MDGEPHQLYIEPVVPEGLQQGIETDCLPAANSYFKRVLFFSTLTHFLNQKAKIKYDEELRQLILRVLPVTVVDLAPAEVCGVGPAAVAQPPAVAALQLS